MFVVPFNPKDMTKDTDETRMEYSPSSQMASRKKADNAPLCSRPFREKSNSWTCAVTSKSHCSGWIFFRHSWHSRIHRCGQWSTAWVPMPSPGCKWVVLKRPDLMGKYCRRNTIWDHSTSRVYCTNRSEFPKLYLPSRRDTCPSRKDVSHSNKMDRFQGIRWSLATCQNRSNRLSSHTLESSLLSS